MMSNNKINNLNHIYQVSQYNEHFDSNSKVDFGYFESYDEAYNAMLEGFEELYKGFKENFYSNGSNQWIDDSHSFGVMINEIELNHFREI